MPKKLTAFFCTECGYESSKWMGVCPSCHATASFSEAPVRNDGKNASHKGNGIRSLSVEKLNEISLAREKRLSTGMQELDRVLGGGIVPSSLILVGGDPGIGKSTILLQVCQYLTEHGTTVLYISGEESKQQIKMRADRIGTFSASLSIASETSLDTIEAYIEEQQPEVVIIDSIQTVFREDIASSPGSVSQVRESTNTLLQIAKSRHVTIFIVGHVTKEGAVAGPRMLEHMVDTVLYFEGDRSNSYRIIRAVKNRFGATNEVGIFEMTGNGLTEVTNPSEYLLTGRPKDSSGSAVTCVLEGTRPMLLEIQSLVTKTNFGLPRRTAVGLDFNRVTLLIAVMEKRAGLSLYEDDIYLNLTGGVKENDPAMDLSIVMAIASGFLDCPIDEKTLAIGEVGLGGEVRGISQAQIRVREAVKLGYERIIIPFANAKGIETGYRKYCMPVHSIREAIKLLQMENNK